MSRFILQSVGFGVLVCFSPFASGQLIIADSADDWDAARLDGIGVGGSAVTAGSADDAAQQMHSDGSGSGTWEYGFGNAVLDGQAFSGGFPLMNNWTGSAWNRDGFGFVSRDGMGPLGSTFVADPMAYRKWRSNGALEGETLTATVVINTLSPFDMGDGATLVFSAPGSVQTFLVEPSELGMEMTFTASWVNTPGNFVMVGIRPEGIGPINAGNFFNDAFRTRLTITPAPGTGMLAVTCVSLGLLRRRRGG